jgi:hypothetical protein
MFKMFFAVSMIAIATGAFAQSSREHDACARDVARFCRAHMNEGDGMILSCLQQNRSRISKGCEKVLVEHGQ